MKYEDPYFICRGASIFEVYVEEWGVGWVCSGNYVECFTVGMLGQVSGSKVNLIGG